MCFSVVKGDWPIQFTPSAPICEIRSVRRVGMLRAMPWQPMPAMARLPSGTRVEVLCGQPEQKNGVRASLICVVAVTGLSKASSRARRCSSTGL